ncbi:MAG TPA: hypothetical protein VLS85_00630 [Hanamia sp.]|nr:hypothetical protein [Hanamia sp.]
MKDRKSLYLLIFSLTVVTISFILISIWGYHFYFAKSKAQPVAQTVQQEPVMVHKISMRDSLQTLLNSTVDELGSTNDSASLDSSADKTLALKLIEFNRLKNEIAEILRNKSSSADMSVASDKISQLQQSVEELRKQNNEVAEENARLNEMVKQLLEKKETPAKRTSTTHSTKRLASSAYTLPLLVSHLRFVGISVSNDKKETNIAANTERLYGSFQINVKPSNKNTAIYVVIVQPNGKTLLNSAWESGTFETKTGSKVYSALLHFDNVKDNGNRLVFSIDSHNFQKGKYAMQIYHQGVMIGRLTRTFY